MGLAIIALIAIIALGIWVLKLRKHIKSYDTHLRNDGNEIGGNLSIGEEVSEGQSHEPDHIHRLQDRSINELGGRLGRD